MPASKQKSPTRNVSVPRNVGDAYSIGERQICRTDAP
jgi:hypothetical protein